MFKKQTDLTNATFDTLVGANTELNGNVISKGIIRIDGKVTGNVTVQGDLFIGENAFIKGDLTASNIQIAGSVEGSVFSSGLLILMPTARMLGDIQVKSFVCEEGSIFEGTCKMVEAPVASTTLLGKKKEYKKSIAMDEE